MTDCCLCVCWRPQSHTRFIAGLYPPGARGNEPGLVPVNTSKLTAYALARPKYLPAIGRELERRAKRDLRRSRFG
jgi:hypothetical protein